jgi:hypothetical protein
LQIWTVIFLLGGVVGAAIAISDQKSGRAVENHRHGLSVTVKREEEPARFQKIIFDYWISSGLSFALGLTGLIILKLT